MPGLGPNDPFIVFAYSRRSRAKSQTLARASAGRRTAHRRPTRFISCASRHAGSRVALRLVPPHAAEQRTPHACAPSFAWFASSLGDVRDLDVYTESFKTYASARYRPSSGASLSGYELYLRRERAEARRQATAAFASPRSAALFDRSRSGVRRSRTERRRAASLALANRARRLSRRGIRSSVTRVRRLGAHSTCRSRPAALHELRIKAKRLRYELEFFAEVYPAADADGQSLQVAPGSARHASRRVYGQRALAPLRHICEARRPTAHLPPALVELRRSQLALARGVRRSFTEQWPGVRRDSSTPRGEPLP